jgi:hypothetical protein
MSLCLCRNLRKAHKLTAKFAVNRIRQIFRECNLRMEQAYRQKNREYNLSLTLEKCKSLAIGKFPPPPNKCGKTLCYESRWIGHRMAVARVVPRMHTVRGISLNWLTWRDIHNDSHVDAATRIYRCHVRLHSLNNARIEDIYIYIYFSAIYKGIWLSAYWQVRPRMQRPVVLCTFQNAQDQSTRNNFISCLLWISLTVTYVERKKWKLYMFGKNKTFGVKETLNKQPIYMWQKEELGDLCKSRTINNWHEYAYYS